MLKNLFLSLLFAFAILVSLTADTRAQSNLLTDANNDGKVDGADYVIWLNNYGKNTTDGKSKGDFNIDGFVDGLDYVLWLNDYGKTVLPGTDPLPTISLNPTFSPSQHQLEWSQHAFNAQRTAWAPYELNPWIDKNSGTTRWSFAWKRTDVPTRSLYQVFPIVGDGKVYVATSSNRLYALNLTNGNTVWSVIPGGDLLSTPAYDPETKSVFVTGGTRLYRILSTNGQIIQSYNANSLLETSPLLVGNFVYVTAVDGKLHKINKQNMSSSTQDGGWIFNPGTGVKQVTTASYSATRRRLIYASIQI